jgi:3-oxoisoapionate kinase
LLAETQEREAKPLFVVGSSGIGNALTNHWQAAAPAASPVQQVDRVVVLSGSCSPVTGRQIAWAIEHGFTEVPLDTVRLAQSKNRGAEITAVAARITSEFDAGRSIIAHTSRGQVEDRLAASHLQIADGGTAGKALGTILGQLLSEVLRSTRVPRLAIAGGDTSGHVARALGIESLQMIGPLEPGAPLCRASSSDAAVDGIEIAFKGGQVGHDDFFSTLLRGQPSR